MNKLKSLNASTAKVEMTDNDRTRLEMSKLKLSLTKKLLSTHLTNDNIGYTLNQMDLQLKTFSIKKKTSKEKSREVIWESIGSCSVYNDQLQELMH